MTRMPHGSLPNNLSRLFRLSYCIYENISPNSIPS